jgi:putative membrane protein
LKPWPVPPEPDPNLDNLRLAYERTALAWTRTALSLIGFGFSIDKLFEAVKTPFPIGPRAIGITMIAFGLLALLLFVIEVRKFHNRYAQMPRSIANVLAAMIGLLGLMALSAALFS